LSKLHRERAFAQTKRNHNASASSGAYETLLLRVAAICAADAAQIAATLNKYEPCSGKESKKHT